MSRIPITIVGLPSTLERCLIVKCCVNRDCRAEFNHLDGGDLYAFERQCADTEFFWLCSACASQFDLYLDPTVCVSLRPRGDKGQAPHPDGTLRLVARAERSIPSRQDIPADDSATATEDSGEWGGLAHCPRP